MEVSNLLVRNRFLSFCKTSYSLEFAFCSIHTERICTYRGNPKHCCKRLAPAGLINPKLHIRYCSSSRAVNRRPPTVSASGAVKLLLVQSIENIRVFFCKHKKHEGIGRPTLPVVNTPIALFVHS